MQPALSPSVERSTHPLFRHDLAWGLAALVATLLCAVAAARAPFLVGITMTLLLAGPHHLTEIAYLMSHMPARWGRRHRWFTTALLGLLTLSAAWWALPWWAGSSNAGWERWLLAQRAWMLGVLGWVLLLAWLQGRPGRSVALVGLLGTCVVVAWPWPWDLTLVYLHPLVGLLFTARELRRRQHLRAVFAAVLLGLPLLGWWVWSHASLQPTAAHGVLMPQLASLTGAEELAPQGPQRAVALYVFLQALHYGVWLFVLPALRFGPLPWTRRKLPLLRRSRSLATGLVACGGAITTALWLGFWTAPAATWDLYFSVAIVHVIAEPAFLLHKHPLRRPSAVPGSAMMMGSPAVLAPGLATARSQARGAGC